MNFIRNNSEGHQTRAMARTKKSRSARSSPTSKASQPSQEEAGSLNPTIGGCSGNTSSAEGGVEVKLEEMEQVERKIKEEVKREDKEVGFPSAFDLSPPLTTGERARVKETWWRGKEDDAKCVQAWII